MTAVSSAALADQVREVLGTNAQSASRDGYNETHALAESEAIAALDRLVALLDSERQARENAERDAAIKDRAMTDYFADASRRAESAERRVNLLESGRLTLVSELLCPECDELLYMGHDPECSTTHEAVEDDPMLAPKGFGADAEPPYGDDSGGTGGGKRLTLRQDRDMWKRHALAMSKDQRRTICGVVTHSPWHDPVACAFSPGHHSPGHHGNHSWASIPALEDDWAEHRFYQLKQEADDANAGLTQLRDAWNAHMETCQQDAVLPLLPAPTMDQIREWQNAPSDTATAEPTCETCGGDLVATAAGRLVCGGECPN